MHYSKFFFLTYGFELVFSSFHLMDSFKIILNHNIEKLNSPIKTKTISI